MAHTELIVQSISMVEVDSETNIPTLVTYSNDRPVIGRAALRESRKQDKLLNEDFKIDLGSYEPGVVNKKRFATASRTDKSAAEITADFFDQLLTVTRAWLSLNGLDVAPSVLLAEPLKDPNAPDWIRNYRANLERILIGKGFPKSKIDFLPEPFAVFQYYRYGFRHPVLADKRNHRALVLDFGGGTFDACVVESKKDGDISQSGRNSSPLGASSIPIGGFEINRRIAEHLAFRTHAGQEAKVRKALDLYKRWRRSPEDLGSYSEDYSTFVFNFDRFVHDVEQGKIALSRNITSWSLDNPPSFSVPFRAPVSFFSKDAQYVSIHLKTSELLKIFISRVWPELKQIIDSTIRRAKLEMANAPITTVLLSGGSASFGWLRELLKREFTSELSGVPILSLPEYHEIVAKGLAIECARRFYVERGDFGATTYNRLCLTLDADGRGQVLPKYAPRFGSEKLNLPEGVLLPSSSALGTMIDKPLRWKFRLDHPPKKQLDYFFLRSSFDPEDLENLQNLQHKVVHSPKGATFDSTLQLELTVSEKGTAYPKFVYKTSRDGTDEIAVQGQPFYLDMTYGSGATTDSAYLGIDFGTSNSAIAYLSDQTMDRIQIRSADTNWLSMQDLTKALPYPVARPLSRVMSLAGNVESAQGKMRVLDFFESAIGLLATAAYLEHCAVSCSQTKILKGFTKRSIGPLWALLRESLGSLGKNAQIVRPAMRLIEPELRTEIDKWVTAMNDLKHGKGGGSNIDWVNAMTLVGNICNDVFSTRFFGYFENVKKKQFARTYTGRFRIAHGSSQPFQLWMDYEGSESFSDYDPFILDLNTGEALSMMPLGFWDQCEKHGIEDEPHFFMLDLLSNAGVSYKALGFDCSLALQADEKYSPVQEAIQQWRTEDPKLEKIELEKIAVPEEVEPLI